jgi:hypothetical protein
VSGISDNLRKCSAPQHQVEHRDGDYEVKSIEAVKCAANRRRRYYRTARDTNAVLDRLEDNARTGENATA